MICVRNISKAFDQTPALSGLDMTVKRGSVYGLVGANGAGKTTILKMLTGVLIPDGGEIMVEDEPVFENEIIKGRMAFIPDDLGYLGKYTPKDLARLYGSLYERWQGGMYQRVMDEFRLAGNVPFSRFSKGMQKQAVFALVLATCPDYLILDEPVDGLDPIAKKIVWYYIKYAVETRQMTVLISSHNLRELEGICDSVGIIDHGRMVLERELSEFSTGIHKLQISFGSASSLAGEWEGSLAPEGATETDEGAAPVDADAKVREQEGSLTPGGATETDEGVAPADADVGARVREQEGSLTPENATETAESAAPAVAPAAPVAPDARASKPSLTPEAAYAGLNIIHMERRGAVDIIIARESRERLERWNEEFRPLLFDPIPLTLEEVFIYELGGADYANRSIFE